MEFYESNPPDAMFGVPQILPESQQWSIGWDTVCHLEWDDPHIMSGLAAYHVGCLEGVNESDIRCSESDANQGWGSYPDPGGQVHFHHTVFPAGQDLIDGKGEVSLE